MRASGPTYSPRAPPIAVASDMALVVRTGGRKILHMSGGTMWKVLLKRSPRETPQTLGDSRRSGRAYHCRRVAMQAQMLHRRDSTAWCILSETNRKRYVRRGDARSNRLGSTWCNSKGTTSR